MKVYATVALSELRFLFNNVRMLLARAHYDLRLVNLSTEETTDTRLIRVKPNYVVYI